MKPKHFLSSLDEKRIVAAIEEAERTTTGEIRVYISKSDLDGEDVVERAKKRFLKLGMEKTRDRNAVLIYFCPQSQQYAVIGDAGIHERCGDIFWERLTRVMNEALQRQAFTEAIVTAIQKCGKLLSEHFPHEGEKENQLPNELE